MLAPVDNNPATTGDWTAREWANSISGCWRDSFLAILSTGRQLIAAKAALPHGEFGTMCETQLPFKARVAQMLMAIAEDQRLTNPHHVAVLPPHYGTLYELTKLTDDEFQRGIEAGAINPELERKALINGARSLMGSRVEPSDSADYFPTPPWATRALFEHVLPFFDGDIYPFDGGVNSTLSAWEPACGEGHIAEVLREYFQNVTATDLNAYGYGAAGQDFLDPETEFHADWIVTNPPFGDLTEKFILRALKLAKRGVAMFVRLQLLEGIGRFKSIYSEKPPTVVAFFAERVNLCKGLWDPNGDTATAYIWLVWRHGRQPAAPIWISPGQRDELSKPDDIERFTTHPVTRRA